MTFHHRLHGLTQIISLKSGQNETGTFRNKKTGKKKVFYPDISWLENSQFVSGYFYIFYYVLFLRLKQIRSI